MKIYKNNKYNVKLSELEKDIVTTETDLNNEIQYETFLKLLRTKQFNVDLMFMNENKIKDVPDIMIEHFNDILLMCKYEYDYSLLTILAKISEEFLDTSKIKKYINNSVKWELIDEIRRMHPVIKKMFPESSTNILF
jgi:hypothetical protein